ncbi:MAG: PfkB family carbohydrate kinase [Bdellovibrionota bacterium]
MANILVVGSLAYDSISTPAGKVDRTLGGSANYFSLAASLYSPVRVVGVVGDDYEKADLEMLTSRKVDVAGLQKVPGKTFHWTGKYNDNMNEAITLATDLNVFADFNPTLPAEYRDSQYVFLANIDPILQLRVLEQIQSPKLVASDTMNFWISSKLPELKKVLAKVDVLLVNEGEANGITSKRNAIAAAQEILKMGPKAVVIKRGEYGFVLCTSEGYFILPAFPVANVVDPTGAGDTFAGAFFGYLSKKNNGFDIASLKQACIQGCLLASFTVEEFGVGRLKELTWAEVEHRAAQFHNVTHL